MIKFKPNVKASAKIQTNKDGNITSINFEQNQTKKSIRFM